MKITIKRYFERTRQIADFVPVKSACEAAIEFEIPDEEAQSVLLAAGMKAYAPESDMIDQFVQAEVEKTLMGYTPTCVVCGGKQIYPKRDLTKAGLCDTCNDKQMFEARQFKSDNAKNRAAKAERGETTVEYT
jgi:hypothetical protein